MSVKAGIAAGTKALDHRDDPDKKQGMEIELETIFVGIEFKAFSTYR